MWTINYYLHIQGNYKSTQITIKKLKGEVTRIIQVQIISTNQSTQNCLFQLATTVITFQTQQIQWNWKNAVPSMNCKLNTNKPDDLHLAPIFWHQTLQKLDIAIEYDIRDLEEIEREDQRSDTYLWTLRIEHHESNDNGDWCRFRHHEHPKSNTNYEWWRRWTRVCILKVEELKEPIAAAPLFKCLGILELFWTRLIKTTKKTQFNLIRC